MTLENFIWDSTFDSKMKFLFISVRVPDREHVYNIHTYTVSINKIYIEDFYNEYVKPTSEIESFHFMGDYIGIKLKENGQ